MTVRSNVSVNIVAAAHINGTKRKTPTKNINGILIDLFELNH